MRKLLAIFEDKEFVFDISEFDFEILNEEYPYSWGDEEFDENKFAEFMTEIDNLVEFIIEDVTPFDKMDLRNDCHIEYFISRDNYDIICKIIRLF